MGLVVDKGETAAVAALSILGDAGDLPPGGSKFTLILHPCKQMFEKSS